MAGILLEPLGSQQRVDEVDHQSRGHEARKRIIEDHGEASSEPIAGDGVADRQREEDECDGEHDDVQHVDAPSNEQYSARSGWLPARHAVLAPARLVATDRIGIREYGRRGDIGIS